MIYIDTNIFLYAADKDAMYYTISKDFLTHCVKENIQITTSTETMQEVIHYLKNRNMVKQAIQICHNILKFIPVPLAIDISVLEVFLKVVEEYGDSKKIQSRDLLHLAACIENNIDTIVTYDKAFSILKEVNALTAEQFLNRA